MSASEPEDDELALLITRMSAGDAEADAKLWTKLYPLLLEKARAMMRRQPRNHTLQATALIGLAYERIHNLAGRKWTDGSHLLATISLAMYSALVDHARRKESRAPTSNDAEDLLQCVEAKVHNLVDFDDALKRLEQCDAGTVTAFKLVALGYSTGEAATLLGISRRTLYRNLKENRPLLRKLMS